MYTCMHSCIHALHLHDVPTCITMGNIQTTLHLTHARSIGQSMVKLGYHEPRHGRYWWDINGRVEHVAAQTYPAIEGKRRCSLGVSAFWQLETSFNCSLWHNHTYYLRLVIRMQGFSYLVSFGKMISPWFLHDWAGWDWGRRKMDNLPSSSAVRTATCTERDINMLRSRVIGDDNPNYPHQCHSCLLTEHRCPRAEHLKTQQRSSRRWKHCHACHRIHQR